MVHPKFYESFSVYQCRLCQEQNTLNCLKGFWNKFLAAYTGRRSLEQKKKGLNTNIQSTGRQIMDGEQEKIHDTTHVLDTYTYSPDPFAVSLCLSISLSQFLLVANLFPFSLFS